MSKTAQTVWMEVASIDELPAQMGKTVRLNGHEVALFKLANGEIKAIQNRCPHKSGGLAEGMVCGEYVFCPMHDRKIHIPSGQVQAPDTGCVKTYGVSVLDGKVYLELPEADVLAG